MNPRAKLIKELVRDSLYVVDEAAVAEAIIARSIARQALPDRYFGYVPSEPQVRSFRPHSGAPSFRLCRSDRRSSHPNDEQPEPTPRH